jgi:Mg2+ and Co2+ transporter CorA
MEVKGMDNKVSAQAPQEPLNMIAEEILDVLEAIENKVDSIDARLYGNDVAKCVAEKKCTPDGLQSKLEAALRTAGNLHKRLDVLTSKM